MNEMGQVTGVSQGEATITVTTKDGGFTDTCLVTVTPDEPPVNLYGFIWAQFADDTGGLLSGAEYLGPFTDTNPRTPRSWARCLQAMVCRRERWCSARS